MSIRLVLQPAAAHFRQAKRVGDQLIHLLRVGADRTERALTLRLQAAGVFLREDAAETVDGAQGRP